MRRRHRKKLHRGEFASYGFEVRANLEHVTEAEREPMFWRAVDVFEASGLSMGGGVDARWTLYVHACGCKVCGRRYKSANDDDRKAIMDYLVEAGAQDVYVGPLEYSWA